MNGANGPNAALLAMLAPLGISGQAYGANSRYSGVPTTTVTMSDGRTVSCLTRRFVPQPSSLATLQLVTVRSGDRLDRLAAQYLGDPLLFWRICDANGAIRPDELIEDPGSTIRITLPAGIPGAPNG